MMRGMTNKTIGIPDELHEYVVEVGAREPDVLARLRDETSAMPQARMQIAPEEGAFLAMLAELVGARRCIEVGTFTGYSSVAVARALPEDGRLLCCDISKEWTDVARRYWAEAGVAEKIDLRIAPAEQTLDSLIDAGEEGTYDFAFVDADKTGYSTYYDRLLRLVRPGGLIAFDNTLWGGRVIDDTVDDKDTAAIREFNRRLADDDRVSLSMLPVADGVTLARRR